jgi:obg-like ATPase 1
MWHSSKKNPKLKLPLMFFSVMDRVKELLEANKPLRGAEWTAAEIEKINELVPACITTKPQIFLLNCKKSTYIKGSSKYFPPIKKWVAEHLPQSICIPVSVEYEEDLRQCRKDGNDVGVQKLIDATKGRGSAIPKIIKSGYVSLDLMYFFTAGEKEVRCWTVMKGVAAPQAAGVIHSDFEKNFIKAEVVSFTDFEELSGGAKSMAPLKAAGKYRQEGKEYIVQDGECVHFLMCCLFLTLSCTFSTNTLTLTLCISASLMFLSAPSASSNTRSASSNKAWYPESTQSLQRGIVPMTLAIPKLVSSLCTCFRL